MKGKGIRQSRLRRTPTLLPARVLTWTRPIIPPQLAASLLLQGGTKPTFFAVFTVHADGTFTVEVTQATGNKALDALALEAANLWTFEPATIDGRPVDSYLRLRVEFDLE